MSHTFSSAHVHCVFSTRERVAHITPELESQLWSYIGGIARNHGFTSHAVGGVEDHMHVLLTIPPRISVAEAVQAIKGVSSKWIHETRPDQKDFAWQQGYGAFSIGISQMDDTIRYINNQREHHKKRDFQEEFLAFLKKHGIEYDPKYVWG